MGHDDLGLHRRVVVSLSMDWQAALDGIDGQIRSTARGPTSLAPGRSEATPLRRLAERCSPPTSSEALGRSLTIIATSWREHFPGNLFWDADLLAQTLGRLQPEAMLDRARQLAELSRAFGCRTDIRFQYLHDFTYGFDWARWVARDPAQRSGTGPFDGTFLGYLERRKKELEALIQTNDEKYHQLSPREVRNPFPFARDPESERTLFLELVRRDVIPVQTWDPLGACRWDRDYAELRLQAARDLGLEGASG